jgi:pteridine reductase
MAKTALVTGAANRIGAEIATQLHENGYSVAVHYNTSESQAQELVGLLNSTRTDSAIALQGDLNDPDTARMLIDAISAKWGILNVLINNASIYERSDPSTANAELFDKIIATNLRAPYLLSSAARPLLSENQGSIVNITDISAFRPQLGYAIYSASKAALIGLTTALARDFAPDIRVNGVSPGAIIWAQGDDAGHRTNVIRNTPLGRHGAIADIAQAVCYLVSAPYVTGHILNVDGGRSVHL